MQLSIESPLCINIIRSASRSKPVHTQLPLPSAGASSSASTSKPTWLRHPRGATRNNAIIPKCSCERPPKTARRLSDNYLDYQIRSMITSHPSRRRLLPLPVFRPRYAFRKIKTGGVVESMVVETESNRVVLLTLRIVLLSSWTSKARWALMETASDSRD